MSSLSKRDNARRLFSLASAGFLTGTWPVLSLLNANIQEFIDLGDALGIAFTVGMVGATVAFLAGLVLPGRLGDRVALAFCAAILGTFFFAIVKETLLAVEIYSLKSIILAWFALLCVLVLLTFHLAKFAAFSRFFLTAIVVMNGFPAAGIAYGSLLSNGSETERQARDDGAHKVAPSELPHIVYLVLDGYGRSDLLRENHGYDNDAFIASLKARGFYVADKATSNYPRTLFSINSALNMDYHDIEAGPDIVDGTWQQHTFVGNNPVVRTLRAAGYRYDYFEKGAWVNGFQCLGYEDVCIRCNNADISVFALRTMDLTPLTVVVRRFFPKLYERFTAACEFDDLTQRLRPADGRPVFLFAHILSPHQPYRFAADCNKSGQILLGGDVGREEEKQLYRDQADCTNAQTLQFLDRVDSLYPGALVVIQGDHGPDFMGFFETPGPNLSEPQIADRYSVLSSFRLPEACRERLYPKISLVNVFRVILSCVEGRTIPLAEDKSIVFKDYLEPAKGISRIWKQP